MSQDKEPDLQLQMDSVRVALKALIGKLCAITGSPTVTVSAGQLDAADERYALHHSVNDADGSVTLWIERVGERPSNILVPGSKIILAK